MARRKRRDSQNNGSPAWMTTFSDLMTLLLTFFILLFAFSSVDVLKWQQVVASVKGSLGILDGGKTLNDNVLIEKGQRDGSISQRLVIDENLESIARMQQEKEEMENLREELSQILETADARVRVSIDQRGVVIRFQDSVLFDRSKAELKPMAKELLNKVGTVLQGIDKPVRIEGHTDDLPIHTERFPSNWELSTSRATNVLRYLLDFGLNPEKLSAVGYGEYHPLVDNIDENTRQKNRRVDIVILKDSLALQEPENN